MEEKDKSYLEEIKIAELDKSLSEMKNGKSPRIDGLTTELITFFGRTSD